jgi:hypothetical protein
VDGFSYAIKKGLDIWTGVHIIDFMKHLNVPIPDDFHKRLKRYCLETDRNMADLVRELLQKFLEKTEKKIK